MAIKLKVQPDIDIKTKTFEEDVRKMLDMPGFKPVILIMKGPEGFWFSTSGEMGRECWGDLQKVLEKYYGRTPTNS